MVTIIMKGGKTLKDGSAEIRKKATLIISPDEQAIGVVIRVPTGGKQVRIGGEQVDINTGFPLDAGDSLSIDNFQGPVYGIVSGVTQVVYFIITK